MQSTINSPQSQLYRLNMQATEEYNAFLKQYFFKLTKSNFKDCIGDNFTEIIRPVNPPPNEVVQIRGMAAQLIPEKTFRVQRELGVDWKGTIRITAKEMRSMPWTGTSFGITKSSGWDMDDMLPTSDWKPWKPFNNINLTLQHQFGAWSILGLDNLHAKVSTMAFNNTDLINIILVKQAMA